MKKITALTVAAVMAVSAGACATVSSAQEAVDLTGFGEGWEFTDVGEKVVGIVPWSMAQEFNSICAETCKQLCTQLGWDATIYDPDADWTQMQSIIEDLIVQGVDGIIFTAIDADAASSIVDKCHDAGIIIVDYDCCAAAGNADMDVVYDDQMGGEMAAELMMEALDGKEDATIVVYEAEPSIASSGLRNNGFLDWMEENYPDVTIVQNRTTDRSSDGFYQWALDMYTAYPEADGFFCNQGDLATSTYYALDSAGADDVYLVGYDATSSHLQIMLDEGPECNFYASIGMFPKEYARTCVEKLDEIWAGTYERQGPDDKVMMVPEALVAPDAENWDH